MNLKEYIENEVPENMEEAEEQNTIENWYPQYMTDEEYKQYVKEYNKFLEETEPVITDEDLENMYNEHLINMYGA